MKVTEEVGKVPEENHSYCYYVISSNLATGKRMGPGNVREEKLHEETLCLNSAGHTVRRF